MKNRIFYIAGVKYYQAESVADKLTEGIELVLVAEPENKFNSNVLAIYYEEEIIGGFTDGDIKKTKLGYVPDKIANELAAEWEMAGEGSPEDCVIFLVASDQSKPTYERYKVLLINIW